MERLKIGTYYIVQGGWFIRLTQIIEGDLIFVGEDGKPQIIERHKIICPLKEYATQSIKPISKFIDTRYPQYSY